AVPAGRQPATRRNARAWRSPAGAPPCRRGGSRRSADRRARPRSCGGSTWRRLPCWCAHGIAIRSRNQIKSTENVALHFRENPTSHKAKSRTYATSTRANCRRSVKQHPIAVSRGSLVGRTVLEGKVIHIPDAQNDPEYTMRDLIKLDPFRTML